MPVVCHINLDYDYRNYGIYGEFLEKLRKDLLSIPSPGPLLQLILAGEDRKRKAEMEFVYDFMKREEREKENEIVNLPLF